MKWGSARGVCWFPFPAVGGERDQNSKLKKKQTTMLSGRMLYTRHKKLNTAA